MLLVLLVFNQYTKRMDDGTRFRHKFAIAVWFECIGCLPFHPLGPLSGVPGWRTPWTSGRGDRGDIPSAGNASLADGRPEVAVATDDKELVR